MSSIDNSQVKPLEADAFAVSSPLKISVIGCGRWGTFLAWYLDRMGHSVTLFGRAGSDRFETLLATHRNGLLELPASIELKQMSRDIADADIIVISVNSQGLRPLMEEISAYGISNTPVVLCMKGIEISTGMRLTEIAELYTGGQNPVAVWLGPGHVQEFCRGVPNCMVIDSRDEETKDRLISAFSSDLIRFYRGTDLLGNEIGAAAKNVIGIAAGMLDGLNLTSLKGALMSRGTREVARLILAMGGNELSAYGLCHLGDYEATVFSQFSHNRKYGEAFVRGESFSELAEGHYTAAAICKLSEKYNVELPICRAVYDILYNGESPKIALDKLFMRSIKKEF